MNKKLVLAILITISVTALGIGQKLLNSEITAQSGEAMVPQFQVDPFWPKPLPNKWLFGNVIGIDIDERDHVYIVQRGDNLTGGELGLDRGTAECCTAAPPLVEFDPQGNIVNAWGGASATGEYEWPASNHGLEIAPNGDIWIGGNGSGDSHILVFTRDGRYIRTIGEPGEDVDSNSTTHFSRVAEIAMDASAGEAYIADGYTNRRVAVLDAATGAFKRYWGAYGNRPDDDADNSYTPGEPLPQQFRGPVHCAEPSNDGLVYVCDRGADRIQVFQTDGTFIQEAQVAPQTLASGSTWDIAFSPDPNQEFIYLADGSNQKVHVLDRNSLEVRYSFGEGGRQPGTFFGAHSIATDSSGNIFLTETYEGKRVQKFVLQGMIPQSRVRDGVNWPPDRL